MTAYGHTPPPTLSCQIPIMAILANSQTFSVLQNILSCILKQDVLAAETDHAAARNGWLGSAMCANVVYGWQRPGFGSAFASMGRLRIFIK